jgi:hypothetical protein
MVGGWEVGKVFDGRCVRRAASRSFYNKRPFLYIWRLKPSPASRLPQDHPTYLSFYPAPSSASNFRNTSSRASRTLATERSPHARNYQPLYPYHTSPHTHTPFPPPLDLAPAPSRIDARAPNPTSNPVYSMLSRIPDEAHVLDAIHSPQHMFVADGSRAALNRGSCRLHRPS